MIFGGSPETGIDSFITDNLYECICLIFSTTFCCSLYKVIIKITMTVYIICQQSLGFDCD